MKLSKKELIRSAVFGFLLGSIYVLFGILSSTNSTAIVGVLFIPFYGSAGAVLSVLAYYCIKQNWLTRSVFAVVLVVLIFGFYERNENLKSASDAGTPASYLVDLAQSKMLFGKESVLLALAANPSSPADLLKKLWDQGSATVRSTIAENPSAPTAFLVQISYEKFNYILHGALALNPNLPEMAIKRLLSAEPSDFSSTTEYKLYQTYVLGPLARHPQLKTEDFMKLTKIQNPEYFLVYGIIESGRADCNLLRTYRDGEYGALNGNAQSQMVKQNCSP